MREYRYETHLHTSDVSVCGKSPADEMIRACIAAGYDGTVVTDHINPSTFAKLDLPGWERKSEHFLKGYRKACEAARGTDFTVLLGAEFHFFENFNDYLVYGLTEDILCREIDDTIFEWGIKRFSAFCRDHDLLLIQAHPFRVDMTMVRPGLLDGIEVMNGHVNHDSRNFLARAFADYAGYIKTAGSDAHHVDDVGQGGIITDHRITDISEIVAEFRKGAKLIIPEGQKQYFE